MKKIAEHRNGRLTLQLGGKPRTLCFDYEFASILAEQYPAFEAICAANPMAMLPMLTHCALLSGDESGELGGVTRKTVGGWLMETDLDEVAQIMPLYQHSMGFMMRSMGITPPTMEPTPAPDSAA